MDADFLKNTACVTCGGEIDFVKEIPVADGVGYACEVCGRLHTQYGVGIRKKQREAFFSEGSVVFRRWKEQDGKPTGTFRCTRCGTIRDGSQLRLYVLVDEAYWGCRDLACEARVEKISGSSKSEQSARIAAL